MDKHISKYDFIDMVNNILNRFEIKDIDNIGQQLKNIIDQEIKMQKEYDKIGIR